ncbi:MAG: hypothetical protein AM324_007310 [Candidatus Thorarchaeota archaeon SMTZ1-83]|nr:MAG: hypothetical protein AM324_08540 [Candidatus Thorarchaeota archaeon SMTZ1-83]
MVTKVEPVEDIVPRILERYEKHPRNWRVMHTPRGEMLVVGPDSVFQLKLISLNPFEFTGSGVEMTKDDNVVKSLKSTPEFGLRPLSDVDIQRIIESLTDSSRPRFDFGEVIKREPMSPSKVRGSSVEHLLSGPILHRPNLGSLSPEILRIQESLDRSARTTFRKRYPERAGMFF